MNQVKTLGLVITLLGCSALVPPAAAQMLHPGYGTMGAPMSNFLSTSHLTTRVMNDQTFKRRASPQAAVAATEERSLAPRTVSFQRVGPPTMPAKLAQAYPSGSRGEAERVFDDLLAKYAKVEDQYGIPRRDLGGSVASFLFGAYVAYHQKSIPDAHYNALVAQMRGIIGNSPDVAAASDAHKQEMYEQMAILGMFTASAHLGLQQQPNPQQAANLKQAAKAYLEQFLRTDADRVQIGAQGLVLK